MIKILLTILSFLSLVSFGCSQKKSDPMVIKIAATPIPQAKMLEFIAPILKNEGYTLDVIIMDDYNLPNRALADGEVDANFFQHKPFLDQQINQFHYDLCILASVHIEPMGIYSTKVSSLDALPEGAIISIPSDPTNESRALLLLEQQGLIALSQGKGQYLTPRDISSNPKKIRFQEIDAATLSRTLPDVSLAVIPTNFALQASLSTQSALALEGIDSPYANIVVVRCKDAGEAKLQALKAAINSSEMFDYIQTQYQGQIIPAFKPSTSQ